MRLDALGTGLAVLLTGVMVTGCSATGDSQDALPPHRTSPPASPTATSVPSPPLPVTPAPTPQTPQSPDGRIIPIPPWRPDMPQPVPPTLHPSPRPVPCASPLPWPGACVVPINPAR